jgi:hypothetical protein
MYHHFQSVVEEGVCEATLYLCWRAMDLIALDTRELCY